MDTTHLIASTNLPEPPEKKAYTDPEMYDIGSATRLVRGDSMGPYRDCANDSTTNWPQPCY